MAFRSPLRPSSLSDAKASTVRPYYLDPYFFPSVVKEQLACRPVSLPAKKLLKTKKVRRVLFEQFKPLNGLNRSFFLRKEVIQPQVPLRLPCYDFTPITGHTLDGCIPCGLAHQLRVQQAFVV